MNTAQKGRVAEAAIVRHFADEYDVFIPAFGNASCDLIVVRDGVAQRVECKYIGSPTAAGNYEASLRQVRHNAQGNTVKKFNADNSDLLALYLAPVDRVVVLDSAPLHGKTSVTVPGR